MKNNSIEIIKVEEKNKYLDEAFSIARHYNKLVSNPHTRIIPYVRERIYIILALTVYVVSMLIIFKEGMIFNCFVAGFFLFAVIFFLKDIIAVHKYISNETKRDANSVLTIDKEKVTLDNKNNHITYECLWENIKYILISNYCISFVPISRDMSRFIITIPIDYKEECFRLLEKYNKMDLVINNKK